MATSTCVHPTLEELFPVFRTCLSRTAIRQLLAQSAPTTTCYWRLFTPLIVLWCLIVQRLQADHTGDAVLSHLHSGAVDALDPDDPHPQPLSQRLRSESTSAYTQGRQRMPLALITAASRLVVQTVQAWVAATPTPPSWKGHAVRLLDGTTFRLAPTPDLVTTYGQARNQHGDGYWVIVRSVASFCLYTQQCCGLAEDRPTRSESAMTRSVLEADPPNTVFVGDSNFGVYRVAQVARALRQHVLLRRQARQARALLRATGYRGPLASGLDWAVCWACGSDTQIDPTLPCDPLPGRIIFVRLTKAGFRPIDLYLFTSLTDPQAYPVADLLALYGLRWQVEVDYRHIKTSMAMDEFTAQTAAMFRKELAAGLLTYNLICATLVQAAQRAHLAPNRLSFQRALRRVRDALLTGVPAWVLHTGQLATYLLSRLAQCRLAHQPLKIAHEPRKVRRRPQVFPALKGDRNRARQQLLQDLGAVAPPAPATQDADAPDRNESQRKAAEMKS
jgi:Transposase DDE domain